MNEFKHITVLANELVDGLGLLPDSIAIDCKPGGGGHTDLLTKKVTGSGRVIGIDQDDLAIETLNARFKDQISSGEVTICKGRFSQIKQLSEGLGIFGKVSGICADLGVSSPQLDKSERGFSFSHDGPLDMRMDQNSDEPSAAHVVANESFENLKLILKKYGEGQRLIL